MSAATTIPTGAGSLVAILGMHRSGTSCLAGSLEARGLYLAEVFEWSPHNLKGNRENAEVMALNDAVLAASGGAWDHPPAEIAWSTEHVARRNDIIARCTKGFRCTWGFKDPRSVFTLPFWQHGNPPIALVGTFRHPLLVAQSLHARNGMPLADGLALWARYNARLLEQRREQPFPIVSFDISSNEYRQAIDQLAARLGLADHDAPGTQPFLEDALRHQEPDESLALPADVASLYAELEAAFQMSRSGQTLD